MLQIKKSLNSAVRLIKHSDYNTRALAVLFVMAIVVSLLIRKSMIHVETTDFTDFLKPWTDHLKAEGLAGLGSNFSNYNTPYLVLLWLVSHLPFSEVVSVKLISIAFDFVLATGVMLVVGHFRPKGKAKYLAFLAVLYAPTVVQNGALWGQCDAIYTSFAVYAFYFCLKNKDLWAWAFWGIAFAFKLQAVFFLPFMLFFMFYKKRNYIGPFVALGVWIVLSALPLFYGKTPMDIINVYIGQTAPPNGVQMLAWFSPTAYQWVSNAHFHEMRSAGVLVGGMVALSGIALAFWRKYNQTTILIIATTILIAVPFFLPQIHERYVFTSEIFMIITAFVVPKFIWAAIAMQIVTTMAYITFFTGANQMPPIPFAELSLVVFAIICFYARYIYQTALPQSAKD
jgi:Gpi18-like mannosyltransferase